MKYHKVAVILVWSALNSDYAPKILLAKRKLSCKTYAGYYAAVGGKVKRNECVIDAAKRELLEETGLFYASTAFELLDCDISNKHKVFFFELHLPYYKVSNIKNLEPDKHTNWKFYSVKEALELNNLMPNLRDILLIKQKTFAKLKQ